MFYSPESNFNLMIKKDIYSTASIKRNGKGKTREAPLKRLKASGISLCQKSAYSESLPQDQFHLSFPNNLFSAFKKGLAVETEKQHGPQGKERCVSVYKHAYLKVKTHFHCMCRFISHSSYV